MNAGAWESQPAAAPAGGGRPRRERSLRSLAQGATILLMAVIFGGAWPGGCSKDDPRLKSYVALSPVAVVLPADKLWAAANYYAGLRPNAVVLSGDGDGMMPLYSSGTLLVVEPIPFARLQEGMSAIYRDADGKLVAHYLVSLLADGWTTRGLNQPEDDVNPMTPANYMGVIVMAFSPEK
jgi:hypothetical protein